MVALLAPYFFCLDPFDLFGYSLFVSFIRKQFTPSVWLHAIFSQTLPKIFFTLWKFVSNLS